MSTAGPAYPLASCPLLLPALAFMVGVGAGLAVGGSSLLWLLAAGGVLAAVPVAALWLAGRRPAAVSLAVLAGVAVAGGVRSSAERGRVEAVAWPAGVVAFEAVVASEVVLRQRSAVFDLLMAGSGRKLRCVMPPGDGARALAVGDRLRLTTRVTPVREWRRGTFSYRRYLLTQGYAGETYAAAGRWQPAGTSWQGLGPWQRLRLRLMTFRHALLARYRQARGADDAYAVVAAMTLGDRSAMTPALRQAYAVSGASHVLALSGLHLGLVYAMLTLPVGRRRRWAAARLLAVAGIWAFVLLVGLPASVVRAAVMISTYALVALAGRRRGAVNALALAAVVIVAVSPYSLADVGFQLSFSAMLAILLLQPPLQGLVSARRQQQWWRPLRWLWGLVTVSVAAQVGVAPLVAYYFGRFPTYFLLTNLIAIPAATVVVWLAPVALLLPAVGGAVLMGVVGWLNGVLAWMAASLPCASIEGLHPSVLQTVLAYVVIVSSYFIYVVYAHRR